MREYPVIIKDNKAEKVNITFPTDSLISHHALQKLNLVMQRRVNDLWKGLRTIEDSFITSYIESINSDKVVYHIIFGYIKDKKIKQANVRYEVITSLLLTDLEVVNHFGKLIPEGLQKEQKSVRRIK